MKTLNLSLFILGALFTSLSVSGFPFSLNFVFLEMDSDEIANSGLLESFLMEPKLSRNEAYAKLRQFVGNNKSMSNTYIEGVVDSTSLGVDRILDLVVENDIEDGMLLQLNPLLRFRVSSVDIEGIDAEFSFEIEFSFLNFKTLEEGLAMGFDYDDSNMPRKKYKMSDYIRPVSSDGMLDLYYGVITNVDNKTAIILLEQTR